MFPSSQQCCKNSVLPCTEGKEKEAEEEEADDKVSHENLDVSLEGTTVKTRQKVSSPEAD